MNETTTRPAGDDLILLAIVGAWVALEAAATLLAMVVALLLLLAGWRPSQAPQNAEAAGIQRPDGAHALPVVITPAEPPALPPAAPLDSLTVMQLRTRARAAGLSQLGRSGRRADLLQALAA